VLLFGSALAHADDWACASERTLELTAPGTLQLNVQAPAAGARLIVEERGADLSVAVAGATPVQVSYPMTRYGWRELQLPDTGEIAINIALWHASHGTVRLRIDCSAPEAARNGWLVQAQQLADGIDRSVQSRPDLALFDRLVAEAPTPADRASALHLLAGALYQADRYPESAAAYRRAHKAWAALGERTRAGAALLGVADLTMRLEQPDAAAVAAREVAQWLDPKGDAYLKLRAQQVLCMLREKAGDSAAAADCLESLVAAYRKAGDPEEALICAVATLSSLRNTPQRERAWKLSRAIERDPLFASAPPMTHGRFYFFQAYLLREQGNLPEALVGFERAIDAFEKATEERIRWQANVMVQVASIYGQLGMIDQAYRLLERSLLLYPPKSAPARVASALMAFAGIERANARETSAAQWFERARRIYELLKMPMERAEAELGMLELIAPTSAAAAAAEMAKARDWSALSSANRGRRELLEVRWLISAERFDEARKRLEALRRDTLSLPHSLLATRLRARLLFAQDDPGAALALLDDSLAALATIATQTHNGGLGYLVLRFGRELREDWTGIALTQLPVAPMQTWWTSVVASSPLQAVAPGRGAPAADPAFSAAVSSELLGDGAKSGASERALLSALAGEKVPAQGADAPKAPALPELAALQRGLGDAWLLIVIPAEPASAALWISAKRTSVVRIAGRAQLRTAIAELMTTLEPDVPVARIGKAATQLSAQLLAGAPVATAPETLYVLSDDLLGTIPLGLLRWPGSERELIDTTTLSWITRFDSVAQDAAPASMAHLHAVIAPGTAATAQAGLARLRYAEHEADLIAAADPELELVRHTGREASRAALVGALADPTAWVHLAAHGYAKPQLLGYAGTWLASANDDGKSEFLSWLDVANTELAAPLAVLNACQLAAGPSVTSQSSLSFAAAVSAAGVDHVIAAFWPISDSASAVWIPAFYVAMRGENADHSSAALRIAQLALKNSRAYRHPYYWASLAHFRRMEVR
jgi:CHAT domain-containing protein